MRDDDVRLVASGAFPDFGKMGREAVGLDGCYQLDYNMRLQGRQNYLIHCCHK